MIHSRVKPTNKQLLSKSMKIPIETKYESHIENYYPKVGKYPLRLSMNHILRSWKRLYCKVLILSSKILKTNKGLVTTCLGVWENTQVAG